MGGGFNGTSGGDMSSKDLLRAILRVRFSGGASTSLVWDEAAQLPEARGFPAVAAANGSLLVVGGYNATTRDDSSMVEALDLTSLVWLNCTNSSEALDTE